MAKTIETHSWRYAVSSAMIFAVCLIGAAVILHTNEIHGVIKVSVIVSGACVVAGLIDYLLVRLNILNRYS